MKPANIAVIGGGLAGLTTSARLAKTGHAVTLFEKNPDIGGKAGEYVRDGYRFDTGPSLLTLKPVIDEFFSFMGHRENPLRFTRLDPVTRYFFPSGKRFNAFANREKLFEEIKRLWPEELPAFKQFHAHATSLYALAGDIFLKNPIHEWRSILKWKFIPILLQSFRLDAFRTMSQSHEAAFRSPELRQFFGRFATYNGSSPYRAPATLNLIAHVELELGAWYVQGGIRALANAIRREAEAKGVLIKTYTPIREILHRENKITGVRVDGGDQAFDAVVVASDAVEANAHLLKNARGPIPQKKVREPSLSGLVFLWGIRGRHDELLHHNVFFSEDYQREFRELFEDQTLPSDPTVYVSVTSKSDPDHAPEGGENWFVMVNAPALPEEGTGTLDLERIRERVLKRLRSSGFDVAQKILFEKTILPIDFRMRDGSFRGAIYGQASHGLNQAFLRQANRHRSIRGLYFAGGAAHPGGGIPLVMESARIVSDFFPGAASL